MRRRIGADSPSVTHLTLHFLRALVALTSPDHILEHVEFDILCLDLLLLCCKLRLQRRQLFAGRAVDAAARARGALYEQVQKDIKDNSLADFEQWVGDWDKVMSKTNALRLQVL